MHTYQNAFNQKRGLDGTLWPPTVATPMRGPLLGRGTWEGFEQLTCGTSQQGFNNRPFVKTPIVWPAGALVWPRLFAWLAGRLMALIDHCPKTARTALTGALPLPTTLEADHGPAIGLDGVISTQYTRTHARGVGHRRFFLVLGCSFVRPQERLNF